MPGQDDMNLCTDKVLSKSRILQELTKAVKLVYAQSLHGSVVLDGDSWLVYWLDRALRHGLRIERHGYWGTARELSHQDTVVVIHALQNVLTSIGKGRAWLYHTLSEGSFESYLNCLLRDSKTLQKQYFPHALLRDIDKTNQLINLLAGLENISFTLQLDVTYLDICNYMPQRPMSGSPPGTALNLHLRSSSVSSSLASPETDNSSYKDSSMEERNLEGSSSSSEDTSEDGKTPVQSPKFSKSDLVNRNVAFYRNSYVINNESNLLELCMTISDCDNDFDTPYSILNTVHMTDGILSSSESVVHRRQRKKKRGESKKRVSFHEDIFKTMKLEDDENFGDFVEKKYAQKGRYSWCANGDSPFTQKSPDSRNVKSDCYSNSTFDFGDEKSCGHLNCSKNSRCTCLSLSERGVPEGQEDPGIHSRAKIEIELEENEAREAYIVEKQFGNVVEDPPAKSEMPNTRTLDSEEPKNSGKHLSSPVKKRNVTTTSVLSGESSKLLAPNSRLPPSKTSLLSRFLRSITERKKIEKKPPKLYIKNPKIEARDFKEVNENLEKEIRENAVLKKEQDSKDSEISEEIREVFKRLIYRDKSEDLYKVYKVRGSYTSNEGSRAMLAILTDKTLYLTGSKVNYCNQFVIPYNELDAVMIGPNAHTILISNADCEMQYLLSTGCSQTTSEFMAHLEIAMRRSPEKPKLPSIRQLNYDDMHALKRSIHSETAVHPDESIEYYTLINIEDEHTSPPGTPCGPKKEGDLMFRPHVYRSLHPNAPTNAWEAGYFVLKGGVVYMFTDSNQRLPIRAIPLKNGLCQGCRRIPHSHRPHTFEILLKPNKSFQFAAPDEYVASDWLQSFVQSASGLFDNADKRVPMGCSLVVTTKHLVAIKEGFLGLERSRTLSCASVEDLTAFRVPRTRQSWCILEFACREVHESSGDWVVYFTNETELVTFQQVLEKLWNDVKKEEFPVTFLSDDRLYRRCYEASKDLENAWEHLLPLE